MKPCLHFPREGDRSTLSSLAKAIAEDNSTDTLIKSKMVAAVARHIALQRDWMLVDALTDDELAHASAVLTGETTE